MDVMEGMRTFAMVASEGSFTTAAKRLDMTTKLASKYVRQLEEKIGAQLLNRTTRSVSLTDVGQTYLEKCLPLIDQFDELHALIEERQADLAGPIRLTSSTFFGSSRLIAALQPFLDKNPKVEVDLHLSDRRVSIIDEGFDLAVRVGALQNSTLMARKLRPMRIVICASPDYLARFGEPGYPTALSTHNCLVNRAAITGNTWRFQDGGKPLNVKVSGTFQSDAPRAIAEMAARGLGIGHCPHYSVEEYINNGRLKLLLEDYEASEMGVYALYPPNRHLTARVRALIDHLADYFSQNSGLFER